MAGQRIPITWRPPWLANLILAGGGSWIEVGSDEVRARMGPLADVRFPKRLVRGAHRRNWPWLFGVGIRFYGLRAVGLVGHRHDVVEILLAHPVRVLAVVPRWIDRLAVSVAEPDRLISLLGALEGRTKGRTAA